jgi:hypothetical protein
MTLAARLQAAERLAARREAESAPARRAALVAQLRTIFTGAKARMPPHLQAVTDQLLALPDEPFVEAVRRMARDAGADV